MHTDSRFEKSILAVALGLPCAASLALMFLAPGRVTPTTYAVVIALLLGTATVALNTWKSAQATGSMGQLLYETNKGQVPAVRRAAPIMTMLVLSAATTALIVATWLW